MFSVAMTGRTRPFFSQHHVSGPYAIWPWHVQGVALGLVVAEALMIARDGGRTGQRQQVITALAQ